MESFLNALRKFNTLKSEAYPTPADVKTVMKGLLEDNQDQDDFFSTMFHLGGAMYLLGSHYYVVKNLMANPEWLAETVFNTALYSTNNKCSRCNDENCEEKSCRDA